jgi:hypothetical protein
MMSFEGKIVRMRYPVACFVLFTLEAACASIMPARRPGAIIVRSDIGRTGSQPDVDVEVTPDKGPAMFAKTDACGMAVIEPLPDGAYSLVAHYGDREGPAQRVIVQTGRDSEVTVRVDEPIPTVVSESAAKMMGPRERIAPSNSSIAHRDSGLRGRR